MERKIKFGKDILVFLAKGTVPAGAIIEVIETIFNRLKRTRIAKSIQNCMKVKRIARRMFKMPKHGCRIKSEKNFLKKNYIAKNIAEKRRDKTTLCSARVVTINSSTMPFHYIEVMKSEIRRLATFANFPDLPKGGFFLKCARAGLFYGGNGDRLTCYSCCLTLGNWTANDDPMELHQEHSPLCDFICQRNNNGNIPITGNVGDSGFRCTFCGCDRGKIHLGRFAKLFLELLINSFILKYHLQFLDKYR